MTRHDLLRSLCAAVVSEQDVDGAGVMLADGHALQFVDAAPSWVEEIERLQEQFGRGPCWDSVSSEQVLVVDEVRSARQWPELASAAGALTAEQGQTLSMVSLPLLAHSRCWGVLDLYRRGPAPWSRTDLIAARSCAQVATAYLVMAAERDAWKAAWVDAEHRSTHDELTGLPSRGLLFDRLEHALAATGRNGGAVAVLFLDIDGFKSVNDAFGHAVGDATLAEVARRLTSTLRSTDTLARLSGDEFVIVCDGLSGSIQDIHRWLRRFAKRIVAELQPQVLTNGTGVSVSIGAAVTRGACSAHALTTDADRAMYEAKAAGGGRLVISPADRVPTFRPRGRSALR